MYKGNKRLATVNIGKFTGDRALDKQLAIKEFAKRGIDIPKGYEIHHTCENGVLQLIKKEIHNDFAHYGGHYYFKK